MKRTQEAGTPFLSLFSPSEILSLAKETGFTKSEYVSGEDIYQRYFASVFSCRELTSDSRVMVVSLTCD